ncbi:DinB family protein [Salinimicrobium terrae]|uniref:DinB family protein n=1 Tax=Salinimicrobium terrae TaxID=470866 RepID=UPI00048B6F4A|nr:DinB family protein [Salinimicrobium terrae]
MDSVADNLRETLVKHLRGGEAFLPIEKMLEKMPFSELGKRPAGLPYSFYELFYHIKFTQDDILEYCKNSDYQAPQWPEDYWPAQQTPNDKTEWDQLKTAYFNDRKELEKLILSEEKDLLEPVPSGEEHTFLREILLVIEHTAYHSGQLLIILRHLGLYSS